jgi:hypothetical protein
MISPFLNNPKARTKYYCAATQNCSILQDVDGETWRVATLNQRNWPLILLLVETCQNINSISILEEYHSEILTFITYFSKFLRKIAGLPNGMRSQYFTSLTNLTLEIAYPSMAYSSLAEDLNVAIFNSIQAFGTLPVLSQLNITVGYGPFVNDISYEWTSPSRSSVVDVQLVSTAKELRAVFENAKRIRYFRFGNGQSRISLIGFGITDIERALFQHRNSLETLRLCAMREAESIGSLSSFRQLKTLTIDIFQLWKWDKAAINRGPNRTTNNHGQFLHLDDVLPKSLETLRVGRASTDWNILPLDSFIQELLELVKCKNNTRLALRGICIGTIPSLNGSWWTNWDDYKHMNRLRTACVYSKVLLTTRSAYCRVCTVPQTYNPSRSWTVLPPCLL